MCNFWNFGHLPSFMPKYGNFENRPVSRKSLPVEQKQAQFQPLESICATFGIPAQIWKFSKSATISETAARRARMSSISSPWVRKREYVPLLDLWPMAKFHGQIWQFWKSAIIAETAAHRAKICSISISWVRKRVYVQLLELWPMRKLVF